MNRKQLAILWTGIAIVILMLLFPPWKYISESNLLPHLEFRGSYSFVLTPPKVPITDYSDSEWRGFHGRGVDVWITRIDIELLGVQILIVALLSIGLLMTFRSKN